MTKNGQQTPNWKNSDKQIYMKAIPMKAIPMNSVCSTYYGNNVDPSVKKTILQYYPNDTAVDYTLGEIRGAFIIDHSHQLTRLKPG